MLRISNFGNPKRFAKEFGWSFSLLVVWHTFGKA
jgi:hypothetical protein